MKTLMSEYRTNNGAYTVSIYKTAQGYTVENTIDNPQTFNSETEAEAFADGWCHNQNYLDAATNTVDSGPVSLLARK